jgi:hypothetical protein
MAKTFGQYTGGIQPIQGISEFGAQQAASIERTMTGLSNSITAGMKGYADNRDKREVTTARGAGLYENLKFMQANIADNPELGQFADRFEPILKKFSQFESMSTNQQAGFLIEAEAFEKSITPSLAIYEKGLTARTRQGVQDALSKEVKIPDNQGGYVKGTPFSTTDTIEENLALARKSFEVQAKIGNLKSFDIESALGKLTTQWENGFANDPNMAKTDPALRDAILKNISDFRNKNKIAGEIAGQSSEDYGTGENIMGQVAALSEAQQGAGTSAAKALGDRDIAASLAAQKKSGVISATGTAPAGVEKSQPMLTATQKAINASRPVWDELNKTKTDLEKADEDLERNYKYISSEGKYVPRNGKTGDYAADKKKRDALETKVETLTSKYNGISISNFKDDVAPPAPVDTRPIEQILAERKVNEVKPKTAEDAVINDFAKSVIANTQKTLENTIRTGGNITVGDIARDINRFETQNNPTVAEVNTRYMGGGIGTIKAPSRFTDARADVTNAAAKLGIPADKPMTADQMYKLSKELENQSVLTGTKATKAAKTLEELTPETVGLGTDAATTPAVNKYAKTFDFNTQIQEGVKEGFRQETFAEEKERVRQWFVTNNKGIIPSALEEVYSSIRPETSVRFMNAPDGLGGKIMITPKGAQYIPPDKTTPVTAEQISKNTLYSYGTRTPSGEIIPEERAKGSGIKLAGIASGGEEGAKEFKKLHDDTVKARIIIPKLLAMYKQGKVSRTLIPQPMWGDAESLLAQLKAAIRVETVGTGPVALPEHAMILERIGDPRKFFQFDTIGESKLNSIMKSMEDSLIHNSAGISVSISPSKTDLASSLQQVKLAEKTRAK